MSTSQEAPALIQYACERCKTRFVLPPSSRKLSIAGRARAFSMGVGRTFRHHEGLGAGYDSSRRQLLAKMDDEAYQAFVQSFRFCHECRQFVCNECWSTSRRSCLTCVAKAMTGTVRPRPPFAPTGPEIPRPVVSAVVPRKGRLRRDAALVALAIAIVLLSVEGGYLLVAATSPTPTAAIVYVTPTAPATLIAVASATPTGTPEATPSLTETPTATPSPIASASAGPTASATPTHGPTATPPKGPTPPPVTAPPKTPTPPPLPTANPTPTVPPIGLVTLRCFADQDGVGGYNVSCSGDWTNTGADTVRYYLNSADQGTLNHWNLPPNSYTIQLQVSRSGATSVLASTNPPVLNLTAYLAPPTPTDTPTPAPTPAPTPTP